MAEERQTDKDRRARHRALGLCAYCDRPLSPTSINHCEYHGKLSSARARRRRELGTSKHKEYARKYRVVNRDKARARKLLAWHVQQGNVVRPDRCSKCNKPCKPEAHHEDYSKPMEVRWICRDCHNLEHYPVRAALAPPAGTPQEKP